MSNLFYALLGKKLADANDWKIGFNKWDENWEVAGGYFWSKNPIPVRPDTDYYIKVPTATDINNVDASGGYVSYVGNKANQTFHTPTNCNFIKFQISASSYGTTYKNDICINISGEHNGAYVPYNG
jgi:hypothetical protein